MERRLSLTQMKKGRCVRISLIGGLVASPTKDGMPISFYKENYLKMSNINRSYILTIVENDYPKHPLELDLMAQIHLPDGRVMHTRITEDLCKEVVYVEKEILIDVLSSNISCRLIKDMQKDLQSKIAEILWDKLKQ